MPDPISENGQWNRKLPTLPRPHKEAVGTGMIVKLEKIAGLTAEGLLEDPFTFQCSPINTFPINRSYPQTTYDTVALEQRSRRGVLQLDTITFDSLFCQDPWPWTLLHGDGYVPNPLDMLAKLDRLGKAGTYFWLTARTPAYYSGYDVNMAAALTSMNSEIREGEPDARYVTVSFLEYRDSSLKARQLPGTGGRSKNLPVSLRADQLPADRNSMYELATFYYGSASEWRRIAKANSLTKTAPSTDLRPLGHRKITVPRKA